MKKIIIFLIFFLGIMTVSIANTDINTFINSMSGFNNEFIDSSEYSQVIDGIKRGEFDFNYKKVFTGVFKIIGKEVKNSVGLIFQIILIAVLAGFLNNIKGNFAKEGVHKISFYMCYIVIITLIISSFTGLLAIANDAIFAIIAFLDVFLPMLTGFIVATGSIVTSSMIYPVLVFMTSIISNIVDRFLLPLIMTAFAIGLIANIADKNRIEKLSKFIKSGTMWFLGIILTIFVGVLTLEGTISSTVDGITVKTAKFMFSNGVPVVGKILGDSIDTILGSTIILKDAVGIIGVVILLSIVITPIIKIVLFIILYGGTLAIIEPFSEKRICKCLEETLGASKVLLAVIVTVSVMFVIGIVSMLKMTNVAATFR